MIADELETVAREFYRRVAAGDVDAVLELLSPDVTWTIPGPAGIPYAGSYFGKDGVADFFRILYVHEDLLSFVPDEFIVDASRGIVCVVGSERGIAIQTAKHFEVEWAEVFWIGNGLITKFEEHIDTFTLAAAYSPS